ncbi:putative urea amidolyase [Xylariaceae sp. FL0016]|nr:putative urea amidolyase [Xylariaceae sp. FL0016]
MDRLKCVLVANRGEIACRIIRSAKKAGIRTVSVYTEPDLESQHVVAADTAYLLSGEARSAYLDGSQIISIAKDQGAQAILPGYGFLSENAEFARMVAEAGLVFAGPSPEAIEIMGLKHTAREIAVGAGVPVVPGSRGLLQTSDDAISAATSLGFPVMLKATAGGGGMGLLVCQDEADVSKNFQMVQSRGNALFKNGGVFLERYYPDSRHIEVQVFGNGHGKAISIGERECSIQRRHQKVIEECPSPFIARYPDLRRNLTQHAVKLAETISYGSAGTVEYLVDDDTGDYFFLEMNTRLQVEHGVTEMCYNVDLVLLMLRQADAQLGQLGGLDESELMELQERCLEPHGHAIEARVYAENPARDFAPSPGLLQKVQWHRLEGTRVDTWVRAGNTISATYDPLICKILHHADSRAECMAAMEDILEKSEICGPPVNLEYLLAIIQSQPFKDKNTLTKFTETFPFSPAAIDVLAGGSYTLVQDLGRPTVGHGFGHAGPMDPIAFRAANALVANDTGIEALEITLTGPDLMFLGDAIVAVCGPHVPAQLDGVEFPLWSRVLVRAGQRLTIGKLSQGCRVYLAVFGGFLNVAEWFGSKSTNPMTSVGGYQGRPIRAGDFLRIVAAADIPDLPPVSMPPKLLPKYPDHWEIQVMPGPYETGYVSPDDIKMIYTQEWQISHNAARGGIRIIGPRPTFARPGGGDGGAHPSNVIEYGYPIGGMNWTGDEPVIFPVDCPDFGGFICTLTVIKADFWKVGQLRAGDKVRFRRTTLEDALETRREHERFIENLCVSITAGRWDIVTEFKDTISSPEAAEPGLDQIHVIAEKGSQPAVIYRAAGDDFLLVDYGHGSFDLNHKCRASVLQKALENTIWPKSVDTQGRGSMIWNMVGCGNSLMIYYDGMNLPRADLMRRLLEIEASLGDMRAAKLPNRRFRLPVTFTHPKVDDAMERYMTNQRNIAAYLPDPFKFVAESNGLTVQELKKMLLEMESIVIGVGFFMALPEALPIDPRHRLRAPKMNPSRTFTPEGTFSWGGSAIAVYPVDSPGGFMPMGMTIPGVDVYEYKTGFKGRAPWMFRDMDVISYYEVSAKEYDAKMAAFRCGTYEFEYHDDVFDMESHNKLLKDTEAETAVLQEKRALAQGEMNQREKTLLETWMTEKKKAEADPSEVKSLLEEPGVEAIEAPVNANVWKVLAEEGINLQEGQTIAVLEAMKMEINILVEAKLSRSEVVKILIQPGQGVEAGQPIVLVRTTRR